MNVRISDMDVLLCPDCGGKHDNGWLHHSTITVHSRKEEDGDGIVRVIDGLEDSTYFETSEHIPGRRDTLDISFKCEHCQIPRMLRIQQHEGVTFMKWVESKEDFIA